MSSRAAYFRVEDHLPIDGVAHVTLERAKRLAQALFNSFLSSAESGWIRPYLYRLCTGVSVRGRRLHRLRARS